MLMLGAVLLMLSGVIQADAKKPSIEDVHAHPSSFEGSRLRLCGEVSEDGNVLYSDTIYPIHGRVGVKLRGYSGRGRGQCVTGLLRRADGRIPGKVGDILMTDAPVHPDYVLVTEPS